MGEATEVELLTCQIVKMVSAAGFAYGMTALAQAAAILLDGFEEESESARKLFGESVDDFMDILADDAVLSHPDAAPRALQ